MTRKRLTTRQREALYTAAKIAGEDHPRCNIPGCHQFVLPYQKWVESHYPIPYHWNGTATGVAHARCNFLFWCEVEAPRRAKVDRLVRKSRDIHAPRSVIVGSKASGWKRKMNGTWERRRALATAECDHD